MKSKSINNGVERIFVLILDQGEEAFKAITDFADSEKITGASVTAIGAFSNAKVADSISPPRNTSRLRSVSSARC